MNRTDLVIPAIAGILTALLGVLVVNVESAPLLSGDSPAQRVSHWTMETPPTPFSVSAQNLLLADCETVLAHPDALPLRYLEDDVRAGIPATCRTIAENILRSTPASGHGWLVVAQGAIQEGDEATLNAAIRMSRATAPAEGWIAEDRLMLAEQHFAALEPETLATYEDDIRLLVQTARVDHVAALYAQNPQARDRIGAIVESLPPRAQQRFVGALERAWTGLQ